MLRTPIDTQERFTFPCNNCYDNIYDVHQNFIIIDNLQFFFLNKNKSVFLWVAGLKMFNCLKVSVEDP